MRNIELVVLHCSATPGDMDIGASEIDAWHKERGWDGIGYHGVIRRNGNYEAGRPWAKAGAHAKGHNAHSLGFCLVGGKDGHYNFTDVQMHTLIKLFRIVHGAFPGAQWLGHRDLNPDKECPSFDVARWIDVLRDRA